MRTIRIRKLRAEEAKYKLERELHEAFQAGEQYVEVLHGIGEGVLKRITQEFVTSSGFSRLLPTDPMFPGNPGITKVELFPPGVNRI